MSSDLLTTIARPSSVAIGERQPDAIVTDRVPYRPLIGGLAWTAASKWSAQLLSWVSTLIVVRLLSPEDFGVVGMATVFLGLVTVLSEFGLGATVLYRRDLSDEQLDQLNSLAIVFGIAAFIVSCAMAAPLASFFKTAQLQPVIVILGIGFVISSFQAIPYGELQREQAFKRLAYADAGRMLAQAATTVGLALQGLGYWSLVLGSIAGATVSAVILRRARPRRFARPRLGSIRTALAFSRDVIVSRVSWYAYSNADFAVAGRVLGATELGAYTIAWNLASTSIDKLTDVVSRVAPAFVSEAQHDAAVLRRYVRALTAGISLVTFPTTLGLALVAREGALALLGARWHAAIAPLQLLAIYAAVRSITSIISPVMSAVDLRWAARYSVAFPIAFPSAFYVASRWGIDGIAAAWVLLYPLMYFPIYRRFFRNLAMQPREYLHAIWPALNASMAMAGAILIVKAIWSDRRPSIVFVIVEIAIGAATYLTMLVTAYRDRVRAILHLCVAARRDMVKPVNEP